MILSHTEVEARLNSPDNLCNRDVSVLPVPHGGKIGKDIPPAVKSLMGTLSRIGYKQTEIAAAFDVSQESVSYASRGLVGNRKDDAISEEVNNNAAKIESAAHEKALDCLMDSLVALQPKLQDADLKPKELARIATDMSRVTANLKPKEAANSNVKVVLFSVNNKAEKDYEVIDA